MPRLAMICGILLVLVGLAAYFASDRASVTALIPSFFGLPLTLLGWLGMADSRRKHAMHAAAALALLGLLGSARGLPQAWQLAAGGVVERPAAAIVQAIMALVCLFFVILAIRSFVQARRARAA